MSKQPRADYYVFGLYLTDSQLTKLKECLKSMGKSTDVTQLDSLEINLDDLLNDKNA